MDQLTSKRKTIVMIALMATMFFAAINQTIISSALPKIIAQLGGMEYYSWVITIYMLASTISTVLVGKLSDIYGRKKFILGGILIFMTGTFLTGLSTSIFQMIGFRAIQGIGGGILMSITLTAIGDLYPVQERAKWTGAMMSIFGFSSIIGPVLGGFLVDYIAWKWLFWIFLPLGIVAFVMIWRMFPKTTGDGTNSIDYVGSSLLAVLISSLLLGFSWGGSKYDWNSPQILGLFATTIVSLIVFIIVESKSENPVIPLSIFKSRGVTISLIASFVMSGGMMGAMSYMPFYIQGVEGLSATKSGLYNIPMSIMMIIFSTLVGRWLSKTGNYRLFAAVGLGIMSASMVIMANMGSITMAAISLIVFGVGLGFGMTVFTTAAQNSAPVSQLGVVTSTTTLFRNLGGTIFIAIFGSIMNTSMADKMTTAMTSGSGVDLSKLDAKTAASFQAMANPQLLLNKDKLATVQASMPQQLQDIFTKMMSMVRNVMADALSNVFYIGAALLLVGVIVSLFLKVKPVCEDTEEEVDDMEEKVVNNAF